MVAISSPMNHIVLVVLLFFPLFQPEKFFSFFNGKVFLPHDYSDIYTIKESVKASLSGEK